MSYNLNENSRGEPINGLTYRGGRGGKKGDKPRKKLPKDPEALARKARIAFLRNELKGLRGKLNQAELAREMANNRWLSKVAEVSGHGCNAALDEIRNF